MIRNLGYYVGYSAGLMVGFLNRKKVRTDELKKNVTALLKEVKAQHCDNGKFKDGCGYCDSIKRVEESLKGL